MSYDALGPSHLAGGRRPEAPSGHPLRLQLRLAIIDQDSGFVQVVVKRLQVSGCTYRVFESSVGAEPLAALRVNALLLDPAAVGSDASGYIARLGGRLPKLAIVVCSAPAGVAERIRALRAGADAWLTKPCHPEEALAVLEAALRRHRRDRFSETAGAVTHGELTIRPELHQAYVGSSPALLTAREFDILQLLSLSDRVLRREEIYERIWGYSMAHGDRSVDVFVRKLRTKLQAASPTWTYIHTHFGVGYRFAAQPSAPEPTEIEPEAQPVHPTDETGAPSPGRRFDAAAALQAAHGASVESPPDHHPGLDPAVVF